MAELVYPGALHTRFHHALGAMHLMGQALSTLRSKGHLIWEAEWEAAHIAILLHDVGHGPFSHVLKNHSERRPPRIFVVGNHERTQSPNGRPTRNGDSDV